MKYYVYVLQSIEYKKSYVGITSDLKRRLNQHNKGYNTFSKRYKPWVILYSEIYQNRVDARNREKYLKSGSGRRWLKKHVFS